ncbi:hypothetical protein PILCRDRAFT_809887 [Piloderma croceum F 1598]|uniref:Uncharacterized protein n=1 Tax=Piloderma croceum (strain F 1598) TaxID=765440 RepID=A0A0C3CQG1_PILCF|nr:hypothetical protein PILCRDRAFT_809887 [Piloderma croceum F 1598]
MGVHHTLMCQNPQQAPQSPSHRLTPNLSLIFRMKSRAMSATSFVVSNSFSATGRT